MKIGIIGGTGYIGGKILDEALKRGHEVVSIARKNKLKVKDPKLTEHTFTLFEEDKLEKALKDVDVIISSYHPGYFHVDPKSRFVDAYNTIIKVNKKLGKKLFVIGSSTALFLEDETPVYDGFFNNAFKGFGMALVEVYELLKEVNDFKWTMLMPPIEVTQTPAKGNYRIGTHYLFIDSRGESQISVYDLAAAVLNELEKPQYENSGFTIGY